MPASRLSWLTITPLGLPVVPDVYMRIATSSGSVSTASTRGSTSAGTRSDSGVQPTGSPAGPRVGRPTSVAPSAFCTGAMWAARSASATTTVQSASVMMNSSSAALSLVFRGTNTAPSARVATR